MDQNITVVLEARCARLLVACATPGSSVGMCGLPSLGREKHGLLALRPLPAAPVWAVPAVPAVASFLQRQELLTVRLQVVQ